MAVTTALLSVRLMARNGTSRARVPMARSFAKWLAVAALLRYSSLASLAALISAPGFGYLLGGRQLAELAGLLAIIVIVKHGGNIRRLLAGRESRIDAAKAGKKASADS